ncbi:unnamed protein product [Cylindrotheca closterium]|uniref:Uncharacterized protein n=1 Tax=Cylindrotheca closterium TaxID=2856 RepID=A0AAD2PW83_9STRA|nr:unnamed protein product [Cylindrotheca closterium]
MAPILRGMIVLLAAAILATSGAQEPHCRLCAEDQVLVQSDRSIPKGGTCGEVDELTKNMTVEQCEEKELDLIVAGVRCGCRDQVDFPTCGVQQNPDFCTTGLLDRANETCECYSFCGMDFAGCKRYPGDRLTATNCDTWTVSGCNYASAIDAPNPFLLCVGLCPDGSSIQFPDRVIPSTSVIPTLDGIISLDNNNNGTTKFPTCQEANDYLIESDGLDCTVLQSLSLYCGCQTSAAPTPTDGVATLPPAVGASDLPPPSASPTAPTCTFCPNEQAARNLEFQTPMGFTCADLVDYFKFLPLPLDCKTGNNNVFSEDGDSTTALNRITDFWVDDLEWQSLYEQCQCSNPPPVTDDNNDGADDEGVTAGDGDDNGGGGGTASLNSGGSTFMAGGKGLVSFCTAFGLLFAMLQ